MKLSSDECQGTFTDGKSPMVLVMAWCHQAGANVDPDLCRHTESLGHNELRVMTHSRSVTLVTNPLS